jgi:hypothetical protein
MNVLNIPSVLLDLLLDGRQVREVISFDAGSHKKCLCRSDFLLISSVKGPLPNPISKVGKIPC